MIKFLEKYKYTKWAYDENIVYDVYVDCVY